MEINDKQYQLYIKIARKYAISLPDEKERVKALKWIQKIYTTGEAGSRKTKYHALHLLIICLQRKRLVGPFEYGPKDDKTLLQHGWAYQPADIAKLILENEFERAGRPPISIELSGNLCEFVAYQDIPGFGAHFFYAFSPEHITKWDNLNKEVIPRGMLTTTSLSSPDTSILARTVRQSMDRKQQAEREIAAGALSKKTGHFEDISVLQGTGKLKEGFLAEQPDAEGINTDLLGTAIDAGIIKKGETDLPDELTADGDKVTGPHVERVQVTKRGISTVQKKKKNVKPKVEPIIDGPMHWIETREEYEARRKAAMDKEKEELYARMPEKLRKRLETKFIPKELRKYPGRDPRALRTPEIFRKGAKRPFRKYRPQEFGLKKDEKFEDAIQVFKDLEYKPPKFLRRPPIEEGKELKLLRPKKVVCQRDGEPKTPAAPIPLSKEIENSWERTRLAMQLRGITGAPISAQSREEYGRRLQAIRASQTQPKVMNLDDIEVDIEPEPYTPPERIAFSEYPDESKDLTILSDGEMEFQDVFGEGQLISIDDSPSQPEGVSLGEGSLVSVDGLPPKPEDPALEMLEKAEILLEAEMQTNDIFGEDEIADPRVIFKEINIVGDRTVGSDDDEIPKTGSIKVSKRIIQIPGKEPITQSIFEESGEPLFDDALKAIETDYTPPVCDTMLNAILNKKLNQLKPGDVTPRTYGPWASKFKENIEKIEKGEEPDGDVIGEEEEIDDLSILSDADMETSDLFVNQPWPITLAKSVDQSKRYDKIKSKFEIDKARRIHKERKSQYEDDKDLLDPWYYRSFGENQSNLLDSPIKEGGLEQALLEAPRTPQSIERALLDSPIRDGNLGAALIAPPEDQLAAAAPCEISPKAKVTARRAPISPIKEEIEEEERIRREEEEKDSWALGSDDIAQMKEICGPISDESVEKLRQKKPRPAVPPQAPLGSSGWSTFEERFDKLKRHQISDEGELNLKTEDEARLSPAKIALAKSIKATAEFDNIRNRFRALRGLPPHPEREREDIVRDMLADILDRESHLLEPLLTKKFVDRGGNILDASVVDQGRQPLVPQKVPIKPTARAQQPEEARQMKEMQSRVRRLRGLKSLPDSTEDNELTKFVRCVLQDPLMQIPAEDFDDNIPCPSPAERSLTQAILRPDPENLQGVVEILDDMNVDAADMFADMQNLPPEEVAKMSPTRFALAKSVKASMDFAILKDKLKELRGTPVEGEQRGSPQRINLEYDESASGAGPYSPPCPQNLPAPMAPIRAPIPNIMIHDLSPLDMSPLDMSAQDDAQLGKEAPPGGFNINDYTNDDIMDTSAPCFSDISSQRSPRSSSRPPPVLMFEDQHRPGVLTSPGGFLMKDITDERLMDVSDPFSQQGTPRIFAISPAKSPRSPHYPAYATPKKPPEYNPTKRQLFISPSQSVPRQADQLEDVEFPDEDLPVSLQDECNYGDLYHPLYIPTEQERAEIEAAQVPGSPIVQAPPRPPPLPDGSPIGRTDLLPEEMGFNWLGDMIPFEEQVRGQVYVTPKVQQVPKPGMRKKSRSNIPGAPGIAKSKATTRQQPGVTSKMDIVKEIKPGKETLMKKTTTIRQGGVPASKLEQPKAGARQQGGPPSRMPAPPSRMPAPPSRMPAPPSRMPAPPSRIPPSTSGIPPSPSGIPAAPSRIPAAPSRIPGAPSRIPGAPSRIPGAPSRIPGAPSRIPATPSRMPGPASPNVCPRPSPAATPPTPGSAARSRAVPTSSPRAVPGSSRRPSLIARPPSVAVARPPQASAVCPRPVARPPAMEVIIEASEQTGHPPVVRSARVSIASPPAEIMCPPPQPPPVSPVSGSSAGAASQVSPQSQGHYIQDDRIKGRAKIFMPEKAIQEAQQRRDAAAAAAAALQQKAVRKPLRITPSGNIKGVDRKAITRTMTTVTVGQGANRLEKKASIQLKRDEESKTIVKQNTVTRKEGDRVEQKEYKFGVRKGPDIGKR